MGDCGTINDIGGFDPAFNPYDDSIDTSRMTGKVGLIGVRATTCWCMAQFPVVSSQGALRANSNTTTQLIPYEEEVLTAYEIGTKATLMGAMQLNGAVFFYDYEDKQEQDRAATLVGNISGLTNVDESEIYGAELELTWQLADGLPWQQTVRGWNPKSRSGKRLIRQRALILITSIITMLRGKISP